MRGVNGSQQSAGQLSGDGTLGGLRGRQRDLPETVNAFWQNQSFHNYADYALSGTFRLG